MKDSYQTTNYLVCTSERSGSGLLCNLLKNTGLAGTTISEILHQDHSGTISSVEELRGYLAQSYEMSRTANGVSGCKVHWLHIERISKQINISTDEVISCFPKDIQYIYLKRNDPIKQAISLYIAQRTGQWKKEVSDAKEVFDMTKIDFLQIHLNVKLLCEENNGWSNFFSKNKLVHQRVDYENLINDHQGIALGLLNFLKINYPANINIHTTLVKQADETSILIESRYRQMSKIYLSLCLIPFFIDRKVGFWGIEIKKNWPNLYIILRKIKTFFK